MVCAKWSTNESDGKQRRFEARLRRNRLKGVSIRLKRPENISCSPFVLSRGDLNSDETHRRREAPNLSQRRVGLLYARWRLPGDKQKILTGDSPCSDIAWSQLPQKHKTTTSRLLGFFFLSYRV